MTEEDKEPGHLSDLIINGVGSAAGGTYDKVLIDGVGKVEGSLTARIFKANGQIRVKGELETVEMEVNGIMNLEGPLRVNTMKLDGILHVDGGVTGENCALNGLMTAKGDCELEEFRGVGGFTIEGLLNAGRMDIRLAGAGQAHEIGVETLKVRQGDKSLWNRLLGGIIPKLKSELTAKVIEGDDLDLEYTNADVVRGNYVIIGVGCSVELVEYRTGLTVHPGARIGKEVKTGD
ncbi:hypothetical protein SAMN04487895_106314 [Paenibacillus sophorae]|uniref:Protein CcmA, bactofilin family n=1 Tax=Paenibacillus sophorae TaxID=1333845 RepID=A0A1H8NLR8_9BACL|nr:hypothetical protein [Paenibacillus sophorae]QWU14549.1 hypothetical protein KP014_21850 [Paenibacillus sophorae]SEO30671.1 hypothetical protein SAMN04487895_106314 [Paenibacillus sophorae]